MTRCTIIKWWTVLNKHLLTHWWKKNACFQKQGKKNRKISLFFPKFHICPYLSLPLHFFLLPSQISFRQWCLLHATRLTTRPHLNLSIVIVTLVLSNDDKFMVAICVLWFFGEIHDGLSQESVIGHGFSGDWIYIAIIWVTKTLVQKPDSITVFNFSQWFSKNDCGIFGFNDRCRK